MRVLLLLLAAVVPPQCEQWPAKPAWQWTLEERLTHRFDRDCLAARRAQAADSCRARGRITDFVYGADTPELFLPAQLFDQFLRSAFLSKHPEPFIHRAIDADFALPSTFFATVEANAGDYLRGKLTNCAARDAALQRVRAAFGGDFFDRFLYIVVARGLCVSGDESRESLLRQASCTSAAR